MKKSYYIVHVENDAVWTKIGYFWALEDGLPDNLDEITFTFAEANDIANELNNDENNDYYIETGTCYLVDSLDQVKRFAINTALVAK